jgi:hypothetical protein
MKPFDKNICIFYFLLSVVLIGCKKEPIMIRISGCKIRKIL